MTDQENELHRRLGRMEGYLEVLVESMPKTEERLQKIERKQNWMLGAGSTVIAILGAVVGFFK